MALQRELEAKVKMLCAPVDMCAHLVARGATALQEPLAQALAVLQEVEDFRQALEQQAVWQAQGGGS